MGSLFSGLIAPMLGGLALFLFGMKTVEIALFQWTGDWMKRILGSLTRTPLRGLVAGTATTAVMQSSSAVTVMTIGLVNARLMTFPQTLGIILGTNIGSCLTTELIGVSIGSNMIPLLVTSTVVWLLSWTRWFGLAERYVATFRGIRCLSLTIAGFCCIMLGIHIMQMIVPYLQQHGMLTLFVEWSRRSLLWGIAAGAVLTAIVHSSSATIAITMGLAALQVIPLDLGVAIVLGANVGTCATAMLASIGGSRYGVYVACSHLLLNAGGAALFYPFVAELQTISDLLTADNSELLARAQTIFNIACSLLALPLCYLPVFQRLNGTF